MKEWTYPHELFVEISEPQITELIASGLSLLVVSIMSHGTAGMLRESAGSVAPISDILSSLRSSLPEKIPLVSSLKNINNNSDKCIKNSKGLKYHSSFCY